jgi:hypothetical protein
VNEQEAGDLADEVFNRFKELDASPTESITWALAVIDTVCDTVGMNKAAVYQMALQNVAN